MEHRSEGANSGQLFFVSDDTRQNIRSHAMRQSWRRRRRQARLASDKALLPMPSGVIRHCNSPPADHVPEPQIDERQPSPKTITTKLPIDGVPAQTLAGVNWALAAGRVDPFDTMPVKLTTGHHKLLHHWFSAHATMIFDHPQTDDFNPMRDVWLPLDLSNAASFNAMMAQSAAHLAKMQGVKKSCESLRYKAEAVRVLTGWLGDPVQAVKDDALAAVLRLLTYERYWGTTDEWEVHRDGLQRLIEARGGFATLHSNWRLELMAFLVSLMAQPTWFGSLNGISKLLQQPATSTDPIIACKKSLQRARSVWLVCFIQDLGTLMGKLPEESQHKLSKYNAIQDALVLLQRDLQWQTQRSPQAENHTISGHVRLECLLLISVLLQDDMCTYMSPTASYLALLDAKMNHTQVWWSGSVNCLHNFLSQHVVALPGGIQRMLYASKLTEVLVALSGEARWGMERCLLRILCRPGTSQRRSSFDDSCTPDSLLSSMSGK